MKATRVLCGALGLMLGAGVVAIAPASAQTRSIKIIVANDTEAVTAKGKSWEYFKQEAVKELGQRVNIDVTHGEALFNQKSLVQALQLGSLQFISPAVGLYSGAFPKVTVLVLPYLLPSPAAIKAAMEDPRVGVPLMEDMRKSNIEPLAAWLNGPRDIGTTSAKPILMPADMKGVKIRVPPGANYVETFKALGANVTTMAWGEVPTALRQGVIDAVEPTPNAWLSGHLYETAKQITRTEYVWDFYIVAVNKSWWDKLPDDIRAGLKRAMDRATVWNWENTATVNKEAYEKIKAGGGIVHELDAAQKQAWAAAVRPIWSSVGERLVGKEVMTRLIEIGDAQRK
ncbi:MAG: TRAP transporter substrate-binding protein [Lautropia sp.]